MKLGVNGWRVHGLRTGIGRYLVNVVKYWTETMVNGRFDQINFYTPKPVNRADTPLPVNIHEQVLDSDWSMLAWENAHFSRQAKDDVLFCPSYTRPVLTRGKTVVVTHDATMHMYPELFGWTGWAFYDPFYGWCARHASCVITTTEAAKQDIHQCYRVPLEKIQVINLAPAEVFQPIANRDHIAEIHQKYLGSSAPFFLFVGKLSGRRNVPRLLDAFAELKRRTTLPHKLLFVGPDTQTVNVTEYGAQLGLGNHLIQCKFVSDEDLNALYNAAEAFVMPSMYETVSFPIMEAQAVGTPVVCIDTPGSREMTGGAALFIPKLEVNDMVEAMIHLAEDAPLRRDLSERGRINSQRFSWQRCSQETLETLAKSL